MRRLFPPICFLLFVVIYSLTSHAEAAASDEIATFGTGIALATHHNLIIDDLKSVHKITPIGGYGRGDHLYSKYFPGTAISTAFIYALTARGADSPYLTPNPTYHNVKLADSQTGARIALAVNALLGAFGMTMLFLLVDGLFDTSVAIATTLLVGLTTDWWYESQLFYLEIGAGAFLIGALYAAFKGMPWLSGLMLAASLLFRPTMLVGLPILLYAARKKRSGAWISLVPLAAAVLVLALYNYARFRLPFDFGYGGEGFTTPLVEGLAGVLLSPGHSFVLYSPIVLICIVGVPALWKKDRWLALVSFLAIGGLVLLSALWHSPSGGKVWGSRLVAPGIPAAGVLIAAAVQQVRETRNWLLIGSIALLGVLGASIQLAVVLQDPAISLRDMTASGYATVTESTWSLSKNWLALEIKSLGSWNSCNMGGYLLRLLLARCAG
jgi:hypothetical protein